MRRIDSVRAVVALSLCLTSCGRHGTQSLLEPSRALGAVLAEEAARAAGANKTVVLISPDAHWGPPSTVEEAFKSALFSQGLSVSSAHPVYLGNPMVSRQIGLQPDDFFEAVQSAAAAGVIVSLAGAPMLAPDDAAKLKPGHPPILVVAAASLGNEPGVPGSRARLENLLEAKIIQAVIIDGADAEAPPARNADSTHEVFAQHYSILRPAP